MWLVKDSNAYLYLCDCEPFYVGGDSPTSVGFRVPIEEPWDQDDFPKLEKGEAIKVKIIRADD